jgi:hypothetical protein
MSVKEVFSKSLSEYKSNFGFFVKSVGLFIVLFSLITAIIPVIYFFSDGTYQRLGTLSVSDSSYAEVSSQMIFNQHLNMWIVVAIISLIGMLFSIYAYGGIAGLLIKKKSLTYKSFINEGKNNFWRVLGFCLLVLLIVLISLIIISLPILLVYILRVLGNESTSIAIFATLVFLALILAAIWIMINWIFSFFFFVGKSSRFRDSLRESRELIRGRWWKTFGYLILLFLFLAAVGIVVELPFGLVNLVLDMMGNNNYQSKIIINNLSNFVSIIVQVFTFPFSLLYLKNLFFNYSESKKSNKKIK